MIDDKKRYAQIERNFRDNFNKIIKPQMRMYDDERKNILRKNIILAILAFLIVGIFIFSFSKASEFFTFVSFSAFFILIFLISSSAKSLETKIKTKIMPDLCKCFGDLQWLSGFYKNENIFTASDVVGSYDKCNIDDVFNGSYNDVDIDIVETEFIRESTDSKGRKHDYTFFRGSVIIVPMCKDFSCHTVVRNEKISLNLFGFISKRKEIKLEDPIFQKNYKVYSDDEIEARYLLTTSFMERINNISKVFKANKTHFAFYKGRLLIALSVGRDMFSLCNLFKPLDDSEQFYKLFYELLSIYKLIDYLKLDKKIGL